MSLPLSNLNELRLVQLSKSGDLDAFEKLIMTYEKKVYNMAYRMTGSHEDAQDIAQEVFFKSYCSIKSFRGECSFSTWIYRITTNACLDFIRKRKHSSVSLNEPVHTEDGEIERQVASNAPGPDEQVWGNEFERAVKDEISKMSIDYRTIIILRDIQGLAYEDISNVLKCSLGTVKSRLNRARKALKERLIARELLSEPPVKIVEGRDGR